MRKALIIAGAVVVVLAAAYGVLYYEINTPNTAFTKQRIPESAAQTASRVASGAISELTSSVIGVKQEDGTVAEFAVTSNTAIVMLTADGKSAPTSLSSLHMGETVFINTIPGDATTAQTISIPPTSS